MCLYFGLAPAPYVFTKLLKIPIAFLRRIGSLIIINLDDMLLIGRRVENVQLYSDTVIFLLQELGFEINLKKSVTTPSQEMEFSGMVINSREMTNSLPEEKLEKLKLQCVDLYQSPQVSTIQFTKVLGHLTSTIQAVLPARLNSRFLQQQQIQALKGKKSYLAYMTFNNSSKQELLWWIKIFGDLQWDFSSQSGSTSCAPDGCFIDRMGCSSPGKINKRIMVVSRKEMAYQRVRTTSSKASPPDISQESKIHIQMDSIVALTY